MTNASNAIVSKVWNFCNALRDDGVGYGDYLEQLTYLIFLKMADEYSRPPHNKALGISKTYDWPSLTSKSGADLETNYNQLLRELAKAPGILGQNIPQISKQDPKPRHALQDHSHDRWGKMDRPRRRCQR